MRRLALLFRRYRSAFVLCLLSVGIPFALDVGPDFVRHSKGCGSDDDSGLGAGRYYFRLTRFDRGTVRNRFTKLVTEGEASEGKQTMVNACLSRELDSRLINAMLPAHPRVIVLDTFHWEADCPSTDPASLHLVSSMQEAVNSRTHMILALSDFTQPDLEQKRLTNLVPRTLQDTEAILAPGQWLPLPEGPYVHYALARIGCDIREIPLSWDTFVPASGYNANDKTYLETNLRSSKTIPYLAKSASDVFDPSATQQSAVQKADNGGAELMVPFLNEEEFHPLSATRLLCGSEVGPGGWENCKTVGLDPKIQDEFSGKIIIVCAISEDLHQAPGGSAIPGGVILASYIESLLTNSYYLYGGGEAGLFVSLLWFVVIYLIWERLDSSPLYALLISITASIIFIVLIHVVFAKLFNEWLVLWPPGVIAIIGKLTESLLKRKEATSP